MSVVCSSIYMVDANAFSSSKEQSVIIKKVNEVMTVGFEFTLHHLITSVYPFLLKFYKIAFCKPEAHTFFYNMMEKSFKYRVDNKIQRVDYMDHLINLYNKKEITMDDVTTHGSTFLTDGYETSAVAVSSMLYELGKNKDIQAKLRDEIMKAMPDEESFNYDNIMQLEYLDQVFNEALRLHTALPILPKMCNTPTEVDMLDGNKIYFEKDSVVYIPIMSLHLDEEYYEEPLKFKPERFDADRGGVKAYKERGEFTFICNISLITCITNILGVFLPFGDGPRICVGNRFAIAQTKVAISTLIRKFEVSINKKTADKFVIHPSALLAQYTTPFWIEFKEIA